MSYHDGGTSEELGAALVDSDNEENPSAQPRPVNETNLEFLYLKQIMLEEKQVEHLATKRMILPCIPGGLSRCFKLHVKQISYPGIRLKSEQVPVRLHQALQECQRQCNAILREAAHDGLTRLKAQISTTKAKLPVDWRDRGCQILEENSEK